jgi:hypothetical protein
MAWITEKIQYSRMFACFFGGGRVNEITRGCVGGVWAKSGAFAPNFAHLI